MMAIATKGIAAIHWVPVAERLPALENTDDTTVVMNGQTWPPMHYSKTVVIALSGGGLRTDHMCAMGDGKPMWFAYGDRVTHWMEVEHPSFKYTTHTTQGAQDKGSIKAEQLDRRSPL